MHRDRFQAGIAEDDFIESTSGGITDISGIDIGRNKLTQVGDLFQKTDRLFLSDGFEISLTIVSAIEVMFDLEGMPQRTGDLLREPVVQAVDHVAHVESDIAEM